MIGSIRSNRTGDLYRKRWSHQPPTISSHQSSLTSKKDDELPDLAECSDSEDEDDDPVASIPISKRFSRTYRYPQVANLDVEEEEIQFPPYAPRVHDLPTISNHHIGISPPDGITELLPSLDLTPIHGSSADVPKLKVKRATQSQVRYMTLLHLVTHIWLTQLF